MNNIPKKLKDELSHDNYYRRCVRGVLGFSSECDGRVTWEHAIYFAGKQVQERWAIIPLCEYHHNIGKWQNNGAIDKRKNEWVALNRLFHLPEKEFLEMEVKYKKAFLEWKRKITFLNKLYGSYKGDRKKIANSDLS